MNAVEIIKKKRAGLKLEHEEISFLIKGYVKGNIPDYQISAFLMAVYFQGMDTEETACFTDEMLNSGKVFDFSKIEGLKVDKHSTGGVGDKTSLILAPIVAAAGVNVPMISGRGLGHTGGTLDKLESIPGFTTGLNYTNTKKVLRKNGAALIGQTEEIVPADKLMYALRDVTGTVESIPLITGSIMSKKIAEGIDGLVLDVKTGNGAFMKNLRNAKKLAESLVGTARRFDKNVAAFVTDMNQPLGHCIGNWIEVYECIECMRGVWVEDLMNLTHHLAGTMIWIGGKAGSLEDGIDISFEMIESGKAFKKFKDIVKSQGGDVSFIDDPDKYEPAELKLEITSSSEGYLKSTDCYEIGMAAVELGAGRLTKEDIINPKAGIVFHPKVGEKINKGDVIAELYGDEKLKLFAAQERLLNAIEISETKTRKLKLIKEFLV